MFSPSRIFGAICGAAVVACLLACGATQKVREAAARQKRGNELKMIGLAMHGYQDDKKTFPPDQQALLQWAQTNSPEVVPILQGGQYTVLYAPVRTADLVQGAFVTVMAYENQASPQGRQVLMADGSVQMLTEVDFNAKPRLNAVKK